MRKLYRTWPTWLAILTLAAPAWGAEEATAPTAPTETASAVPATPAAPATTAASPSTAQAGEQGEQGMVGGGFVFDTGSWSEEEGDALDELLAEPTWEGPRFELSGYYRLRWTDLEDPDLDADAGPQRLNFWQHRLRLQPTIALNDKIFLKLDLLAGQNERGCADANRSYLPAPCDGIWGANGLTVLDTNASESVPNIRLVRYWVEATTPIGVVRAGRQPSHWGLGLFANDGEHESLFGDPQFGDTYDRLLFATKPLGPDSDFITALIYDYIAEGGADVGLPTLTDDADDIHEGVLVLLYKTAPLDLGIYQVARYQKDPRNYIWSTDAYGRLDIGLLYGAFEMVWLYGSTRALPILDLNQQQVLEGEKVEVDSWGWAAEVGLRFDWYDVRLNIGSAQGDLNGVDDKRVTSLTFKPDYNVGLIMFDYAYANLVERNLQAKFAKLDALVASGILTAEDAAKLGLAAELARTKGGVSNAFYVNPVATFQPADGVDLRAGFVWAQANDPIPVLGSGLEAVTDDDLGWEIDLGASYTWRRHFRIGAQAGFFFPGSAFDFVETTVDPVSGLEVPLGRRIAADPAQLYQFRLTYSF